ncbi:MAG: pyridoxal phosphate-dependent aminotransferase [Myxococcales bacterium]|nr:MAG: pyridoxal phosphate-dependent aminotransferase [Myxococcales bacterium]
MPNFASRLSRIEESATVALSQRAAELKRQGIDVIAFGVGEPDFPTPQSIRDAATADVAKSSHYTAVRGMPELRSAICTDSAKRRMAHTFSPEEVVVSVGAKHSLFNLALSLFEEGDEVIIPAPYWVSYPEQVRLVGAEAVIAATTIEDNFVLSPEALRKAISKKTKALILCTPSNPTGAAYSPEQLNAIAEVVRKHDMWVIVDEIYSQLVYDNFKQQSFIDVAPDLKDRCIIVDGVSKTYAMTGWRIGWILAPKEVAKACDKLQSQSTTNPTAIAQYAAMAALGCDDSILKDMLATFDKRRHALVNSINAIEGLSCRLPNGAFYAFVDVTKLIGKKASSGELNTDLDVSHFFLNEARCAAVPGSAFGAPGFLRFSYATSIELIEEGCKRIKEAVATLKS